MIITGLLLVIVLLVLLVIAWVPDIRGIRWLASGAAILTLGTGFLVYHHRAPRSPDGWTWPANAAIIPALTAQGQEMALNASVYPVAVVSLHDRSAIAKLNAAYIQPSRAARHIGFLALVDIHPTSNTQALNAARQVMRQQHVALPWVVIIDPPAAYTTPAVQAFLPHASTIQHVTGQALWTDWAHALTPIAPVITPRTVSVPKTVRSAKKVSSQSRSQ
jgi:hypothetical protein